MRSMRIGIQTGLAVAALLSLGILAWTGASAQAPGACADEITQFCSDIPAGSGAIRQCLERYENELSDWCKSSIVGATTQAGLACHDDIILLCKNSGGGRDQILQCLKDRESWLSFECKVKMGLLPANPSN